MTSKKFNCLFNNFSIGDFSLRTVDGKPLIKNVDVIKASHQYFKGIEA